MLVPRRMSFDAHLNACSRAGIVQPVQPANEAVGLAHAGQLRCIAAIWIHRDKG